MTASVVNEKKIKIQIKEREGRSKKHAEIKRGKSRERAKEQNNEKTKRGERNNATSANTNSSNNDYSSGSNNKCSTRRRRLSRPSKMGSRANSKFNKVRAGAVR